MLVAVAVLSVLVIGLAGAVVTLTWLAPWGRVWKRRRMLIHLRDGTTLAGLLVTRTRDALVLQGAAIVADSEQRLAGDLVVPRERVLFVQRLDPE